MDNPTSIVPGNPSQREESVSAQRVFWAAILFTLVALASFIFSLVLVRNFPVWQIYAVSALTAIALMADITGLLFILRGRTLLGIKWLYWSLMIAIPPNALLATNTTPILIAFVLAIGFVNVFYLLPRAMQKSYRYGPVLAVLFMILVEIFHPPFRVNLVASFSASGYFGSITLAFLIVSVILMVLLQSQSAIAASLRLKIIVWAGAIMIVLSVILTAYSIVTARQTAINDAQALALSISEARAGDVKNQIQPALDAARTMAYSLEAVKDPGAPTLLTRDQVNGMLKKVAEGNPTFLGTWTLWEPNAFDGLDAQYANTPLHDETGRFIPYWVRSSSGTVEGVAIIDYETPGLNDWYRIPRETQKETIVSPFFYPVDDVNVLMTSLVVPIVVDETFYGVAGVDVRIDFVQGLVDEINLYNGTATAILLTDTGALVAVSEQPELSLQPATLLFEDFEDIQPRIAAGETLVSPSPDGRYLRVFTPVIIGNSDTNWVFGLIIPFSEITASATSITIRQGAISLTLIMLALFILWYLTGQIMRPIQDLTTAANSFAQGNLAITADVQGTDEIGIMASAFNAMTSQLRETLASLEKRVADRTRNLQLAAEVGRAASQARDLDAMLTDAAELILKQFDLYYAQVYLVNPGETHLILQAGTGEAGRELLSRSHRLPLDTGSINGRAASEKRAVVIADTTASSSFRPNPLLPETRSEVSVPLIFGEEVLGVLDMQSAKAGVLSQDMLPAFETLAGQLAIAIQNARLLAETERAREEVEAQARRLSRANWSEYLDAIHMPEKAGFVFEGGRVAPQTEERPPSENAVVAPIAVTGEALGNLAVELESGQASARARELVDAVARQVAQHIESLRLLETAERYRAEAEEASRRLTREGWREYLQNTGQGSMQYYYDTKTVTPEPPASLENAHSIPIQVRGATLGTLAVLGMDNLSGGERELMEAAAQRLSEHLENLRLTEQTRERAQREQALREITSAVRASTNPENILRAAARELGELLGRRVVIQTNPAARQASES